MLGSHFSRSQTIPWRLGSRRIAAHRNQRVSSTQYVNLIGSLNRLYSNRIPSSLNHVPLRTSIGNLGYSRAFIYETPIINANHLITRNFSFTAVPKFLLKSLRFPVGIAGVGVATATYISNLVNGNKFLIKPKSFLNLSIFHMSETISLPTSFSITKLYLNIFFIIRRGDKKPCA